MTEMEVLDYLEDIIEAAEKIENFTRGMSFEEFESDEKTSDAVLRNFEVIGEAAKNDSEEVQQEYSDVPWTEMAGMRDKLVHGYATIELRIVWTTVEEDIPGLKRQIKRVRDDIMSGDPQTDNSDEV